MGICHYHFGIGYSGNWNSSIFAVSTPDIQLINGITAVESLSGYSKMITFRWVLEALGLALLGFLALVSVKKVNYSSHLYSSRRVFYW